MAGKGGAIHTHEPKVGRQCFAPDNIISKGGLRSASSDDYQRSRHLQYETLGAP